MTIPNTPANGGQIPTWQERVRRIGGSSNPAIHAVAMEKEIADLRAALAAPAIPTVDRNAVLGVPEGYVVMPARLTAENGAKSLFMGEFNESVDMPCHECYGAGGEDCDECDSAGKVSQDVVVGWDTIKNIYALAVKHLSHAPAVAQPARCAADRDGDCTYFECPQLRDNEPRATGRHCPLDTGTEDA